MSYLTIRVNLPQALFQSAILFVLLMATANTGFSQTPTPDKGQVLFSNLIGAEAFIEELATHSRYLFSQEEQEEIDSLLERAEEAEGHSQIASSTEEIEEALTLQEEVDLYLKEFCQRVIQPIEYVIHEGGATTPGPVYQPLPSDHGTLFFRVESGTKRVGFSVVKMNLHELPFSVEPPSFPYIDSGTTWVLVELKNVPAGKAVQKIDFHPVGHPQISIPSGVWVEGPEFGDLRVEVVDEEGSPTPYLIRLVEGRSGKMRRPAGTLSFSDQMDIPAEGRVLGDEAHFVKVPGRSGGMFWVMDQPIDMALPPGEWQALIRHGLEHELVELKIEIESGQKVSRKLQLKRWTNLPERGWWAGDDHVHSRLMSARDAEDLLAWAKAEGIHVANILQMGDSHRTYFQQRGFGPEYRVRDGDHVLVPGQEDPRYFVGHAIGLNLRSLVRFEDEYLINERMADTVHEQGGLYGFAHLAGSLFNIRRDMTLLMHNQKADFGEVLQNNTLGTEPYYEFLDLGFKLTASAGSDVPYGSSLGDVRVYAYLGEDEFSADAWFNAFSRGRTFVTNGPMVDFRIGEAFPGDEIEIKGGERLTGQVTAWGFPGTSAPQRIEIVQNSKVVFQEDLDDPGEDSISLDFKIESQYGSWVAAKVTGYDGTVAHTTPIYLRREGFRFWNPERVESLLEDRFRSLEEMEGILANLEHQKEDGLITQKDVFADKMFRGEKLFREKIDLARESYQRLKDRWEEEKAKRPQ